MRSPSRDVRGPLNSDLDTEERVILSHFAASQDAPVCAYFPLFKPNVHLIQYMPSTLR